MSVVPTVAIISTAAVVTATTVEAAAVIAVVPGAGADEDSTDEVIRPVVTVWGAGVRIVAVVAVGADRRSAVDGTYPNSDAKPYLRVGVARGKK
jgi:hypothetical protein